MAHLRTQIVQAIAAALVAAGTSAGARVHTKRPPDDPIPEASTPAIVIQRGPEQVELDGINATPYQQRSFLIAIKLIACGANAEEDADALLAQVEAALLATTAARTLSGLVKETELVSVDPDLSGVGAQLIAEVITTWRITYVTQAGVPATPA